MKVFSEIPSFKNAIKELRSKGKTIGFVPTMGNLHEGHLSLIRQSVKECDFTVLSIYVNPEQFNNPDDLKKYPRTLERDLELARKEKCDLAFTPSDKLMYPEGYSTYVIEEKLSLPMEGAFRPGHFRGVLTIVNKLFNIVGPDRAFFGQKDAQQAVLIKKMVRDLNLPIDIRVCPIVREKNGLAMSSRNSHLSKDERDRASIIYRSLQAAEELFEKGTVSAEKIKEAVMAQLQERGDIEINYIDLRSCSDLKSINRIEEDCLVAIGANLKGVHLIDNTVIKVKSRN